MPNIYIDKSLRDVATYVNINKRLPRIKLPANKIKMFADWWNSDIRFEDTVPHSFEERLFHS